MLLRTRYAVPGTDPGYAATRLRQLLDERALILGTAPLSSYGIAVQYPIILRAPYAAPPIILRHRYEVPLSSYGIAMKYPCRPTESL
eukprot:3477893-Rhodomonas_salina.2